MPKSKGIKFSEYFKLPNPGLRSYFGIVRKGRDREYRTSFAEGVSVHQVLEEWSPTLDSLTDKWPTLVNFENDLREKVGPMSIMKPLKERMDDIESYYELIKLRSSPIDDSAVKAVIKEFADIRGLQVQRQSLTVDKMRKSTNSGSPYFTKRRNVVDETIFCNVYSEGKLKEWENDGSFSAVNLPDTVMYQNMSKFHYLHEAFDHVDGWRGCAILGWRGQEGGPSFDDVKQRVVWMFPFAVNICELQVYQPLIEACQKQNLVPAWVSMDAVDDRITKLFDSKSDEDLIVCTDFSKFDQHFNPNLQAAAETILRQIFTENVASRWWFDDVYPIKYEIPLAYDWNKIRYGRHGMASGSGGTNADETLTHRALQYEAAQRAGQKLNTNSMCLGDDGLLTYPGITIHKVVKTYQDHGLEMNLDKQYASTDDCTYLRRWHHKNYRVDGRCVGVYSTYRALGRLCEQERFYDPKHWGPEMVALRQLSILENVKYHPLRDQFAEFCMKRDRYRLGIDLPGFLWNIESIAQEANEVMPDFLGYTKSQMSDSGGISDWWIVKYLRSRR